MISMTFFILTKPFFFDIMHPKSKQKFNERRVVKMDTKYNCLECGNPINNNESDQKLFVTTGMCSGCYNSAMKGILESKYTEEINAIISALSKASMEMESLCKSMAEITETIFKLINKLQKGE